MAKRRKLVKKQKRPCKNMITRSLSERLESEKGHFSEKMAKIKEISLAKRMSRCQKQRARRAIIENRPIGRNGRPRLLSDLHEKMLADEVIKSIQSRKLLLAHELGQKV